MNEGDNGSREARTRNRAGFLTRKELAERLGVHPKSVSRWERDGCPVAAKGNRKAPTLFSLVRVETWLQARTSAQQSNGFLSLEAARTAGRPRPTPISSGNCSPPGERAPGQDRRRAGLDKGDRGRPQSLPRLPRPVGGPTPPGRPSRAGAAAVEAMMAEMVRQVLTELSEGAHLPSPGGGEAA